MQHTYSEFSFYSPSLDSNCLRISVSDGRTGEYFSIVPKPPMGKSLRQLRTKVLNAIEAAIEANFLPGEVKVNLSELNSTEER